MIPISVHEGLTASMAGCLPMAMQYACVAHVRIYYDYPTTPLQTLVPNDCEYSCSQSLDTMTNIDIVIYGVHVCTCTDCSI